MDEGKTLGTELNKTISTKTKQNTNYTDHDMLTNQEANYKRT